VGTRPHSTTVTVSAERAIERIIHRTRRRPRTVTADRGYGVV
jgi:hypothetical protein